MTLPGTVTERVTTAPGVELDVHTAGPTDGPAVLLLHGFPESSWSWRHQIAPLTAAGYRVIVPDQRGYAASTATDDSAAYRADHLADDAAAVLDHFGVERAVVVGHDWGAILTWHIAQRHPHRCRAVIAASVPYTPWSQAPTASLRATHGDDFFYILYFQIPGVPERELDADPERFLLSILHVASGDGIRSIVGGPLPAEGTGLTEFFEHQLGGRRSSLPGWLTRADLDVYVEQFTRSGFGRPINWYRNLDANHEMFTPIGTSPITMPTFFVAGELDPVILGRPGYVSRMLDDLPDHRENALIPGIGHWVQQEAPAEFNAVLLRWLASL